jgi:MFS family permease
MRSGAMIRGSQDMNLWRRVFLPFAVGYFFSYLLRNVNAVISPELVREFGLDGAGLGFLTSAYLLAFGAFQLPLGLLLDRYGPRRVEMLLLLVASAGCLLFAAGSGLAGLAAARALIGLGVSACLMASFKAFAQWFPAERLASLNAAIMAAGGLGALAATAPLGWGLPWFGWRGVFVAIAVFGAAAAMVIGTVPDRADAHDRETLAEQLRGLAAVLGSRDYWRFAPQTALVSGGFMAVQGLWAVPWLMHFNGYSRATAAFHLLLSSAAMLAGFVFLATQVLRLKHIGIPPERLFAAGLGAGLGVTLLIVLDAAPTELLWFVLGLVFSVSNLAYALLSTRFPARLAGRSNTALNLAAFAGAFAIQWAFGAAVDGFAAAGLATRDAYRGSLALLLALQAASYLWWRRGATARTE